MFLAPAAWGHVGSKDVFETVQAGPYTLYVTVRPPNVIPGIATVEVRSSGASISSLTVTPLPVTGEASKHPPAADRMQRSTDDKAFYTASVWIMDGGTWQVRFTIDGAAGEQTASVPVVAVPLSVLKMQKGMGATLALLGLFLVLSMAGIVAASVREARLRPGVPATPELRRSGVIAMVGSVVVMLLFVLLGGHWWNVEAAGYAKNIFTPTPTTATLDGNQLKLQLIAARPNSDRRGNFKSGFLPDHGHMMHLYAIRQPGMDVAFHLHPELDAAGNFRMMLPAMPPGRYNLYGDVVHTSGFPETLLATIDVPPTMQGGAPGPEDAKAVTAPIQSGELSTAFKLPDGYTMAWDARPTLTAGTAYTFHFRLMDAAGEPATGMEPYLGMAGHAAFVKTDGTVFAHTHPEGSAAMADVMLANESMPAMAGMDHSGGMAMPVSVAPEVGFPYGFPTAGRYRIFVQMKHAGVVETGVFDAQVK